MKCPLTEKYDRIAMKLPSNKSVACKQAEELLELPTPIQQGVEEVNVSFAEKNSVKEFTAAEKKLLKEKERLLKAFAKLSADSRKILLKLVEDFAAKVSSDN